MKVSTLYFTFVFFLFVFFGHAQNPTSTTLNANRVKATVNSNGLLFFDGEKGQFIAPFEEGEPEVSTLKTAGLWLAGKDETTGELKGAIHLHSEDGKTDFLSGTVPINGTHLLTEFYRVTKSEIEQHLADWNANGIVDSPEPGIFGWPGSGNPYFSDHHNGDELPDYFFGLNNFFDRNQDRNYDPAAGDFPAVNLLGCHHTSLVPDEMLYFVFHDHSEHTESVMEPIRTEIHCTVFAFGCDGSPLDNSVFVKYRLFNRSLSDLDSMYIGLFTDFDIGNPSDDFFGSDISQNIAYAYNGDEVDENGFGENAPAMALDLIRGPLNANRDEVGLTSAMPVGQVPFPTAEAYFNLLSGKFQDGSTPPDGPVFYPGNPNVPGEPSEVSENNMPGERKVVSSFGPFLMNRGSVQEVMFGFTFYQKPAGSPLENVQAIYDRADEIQSLFDDCFYNTPPCFSVANLDSVAVESIKIFPNPASSNLTVEVPDGMEKITMTSFDGRPVFHQNFSTPIYRHFIKTGDLAAGMYFLEIWKNGERAVREKVVVEN